MSRTARTRRSSDDPLRIEWLFCGFGFLLIVRTDRIVTVHVRWYQLPMDRTSTVGYSDVPAYSQVL